ncbi:hypothetical protein Peetri_00088 [Pseudomonas phage vB_PpuM-Peetri]
MGARSDAAHAQLSREMTSVLNRRQRLDRTVDILLRALGMDDDDADKMLDDVQACDFRSLGKLLQEKFPDSPDIEWCLKTHQDYAMVPVERNKP